MGAELSEALGIEIAAYNAQPQAAFGLAGASGDKKISFCKVWPAAREGLTALSAITPASVRMLIAIVTSAGDAAAAAFCRKVA